MRPQVVASPATATQALQKALAHYEQHLASFGLLLDITIGTLRYVDSTAEAVLADIHSTAGWGYRDWAICFGDAYRPLASLHKAIGTPAYEPEVVQVVGYAHEHQFASQVLLLAVRDLYADYASVAAASPEAVMLDEQLQHLDLMAAYLNDYMGTLRVELRAAAAEPLRLLLDTSMALATSNAVLQSERGLLKQQVQDLERGIKALREEAQVLFDPKERLATRALAGRLQIPKKTLLYHVGALRSRGISMPKESQGRGLVFTGEQCERIRRHIKGKEREVNAEKQNQSSYKPVACTSS